MLQYSFMQNAFWVCLMISLLCPCIGIFLVLRRYALIGDTLAHASLAGVTISLVAGQNPVLGAFLFTAGCGALIELLRGVYRRFTDLILSIVMALGVGIAITLISSGRIHANADAILFGSVLTVTRVDLWMVLALSVLAIVLLALLYHPMVYLSYDEETARVAGVRVRWINYIFCILVASAISMSIRIVGALVLSSMIALPVATALQMGKGFRGTLLYSVLFSFLDILTGLFASFYLNVAPGGFTALVCVLVLVLVMLLRRAGRFLGHGREAAGSRANTAGHP